MADGTSVAPIASFGSDAVESMVNFIDNQSFNNGILCNVGHVDAFFVNKLNDRCRTFINFDVETSVPIQNRYETPETLGLDRLAAAVGAHEMFPDAHVLVIDAGTAITIDLIMEGAFIGGSISPGMHLRFESLHRQTKRLPLLKHTADYNYPGRNTHDAVVSGVIQGIVNEIDGTIFSYRKKYSALKVVLTGGDAYIFAEKIKNSIFAEPNLLAKGLNRILIYNVEKI